MGWKAFIHKLVQNPRLMKELSSDVCAVYHSEFFVHDREYKRRIGVWSCEHERGHKKCLKYRVDPERRMFGMKARDMMWEMPSQHMKDRRVKFKANSDVMFKLPEFRIPSGKEPRFEAIPLHKTDPKELEEIEYYNQTTKRWIEHKIRDWERKMREPTRTSDDDISQILGSLVIGSEDLSETPEIPSDIPLFVNAPLLIQTFKSFVEHQDPERFVGEMARHHGVADTDPARLFFDILTAARDIPKCVEDANRHKDQCPKKCFENLLRLRDNLERDSGHIGYLLQVAHMIGYMTEATEEMCNDEQGWEWIGAPHPRPSFNSVDLLKLVTEAGMCAKNIGDLVISDRNQCVPGCTLMWQEMGRAIEKYMHVTVGKIIQESAQKMSKVCHETESVCFSAVDETSCEEMGMKGKCVNGICVANEPVPIPEPQPRFYFF